MSGTPITDDLPYELVSATPAHDVWSLGVVFYELFSGVQLFLANSEDNIQVYLLLWRCFLVLLLYSALPRRTR